MTLSRCYTYRGIKALTTEKICWLILMVPKVETLGFIDQAKNGEDGKRIRRMFTLTTMMSMPTFLRIKRKRSSLAG
jgi:hypothetical protein